MATPSTAPVTPNREAPKVTTRPNGSSIEPQFDSAFEDPSKLKEAYKFLGIVDEPATKFGSLVGLPKKDASSEAPTKAATTEAVEPRTATSVMSADLGRLNTDNSIRAVVGATGSPWDREELRPGKMAIAYGAYRQLMLDAGMDPSKTYTGNGKDTIVGGLTLSIQDPNLGAGRFIDVGLLAVSQNQINFVVPTNVFSAVPSAYDDYNVSPSAVLTLSVRKPDGTYVFRTGSTFPTRISPATENIGLPRGLDFFVQPNPALGGTPFPNGNEISQARALHQNGEDISILNGKAARPGELISLYFTGDSRTTSIIDPTKMKFFNVYGMNNSADRTSYGPVQEQMDVSVLGLSQISPGLFQLNLKLGTKPLQLTADPRNPGKTGIVLSTYVGKTDGSTALPDVMYIPYEN